MHNFYIFCKRTENVHFMDEVVHKKYILLATDTYEIYAHSHESEMMSYVLLD